MMLLLLITIPLLVLRLLIAMMVMVMMMLVLLMMLLGLVLVLLHLGLLVVAVGLLAARRRLRFRAGDFRLLDRFRAVLQVRRLHATEEGLAAHRVTLREHAGRLLTARTSDRSVVTGEHHRSVGIRAHSCPLLSHEHHRVPVRVQHY